MKNLGRNRYGLTLEVELTLPLSSENENMTAQAAAELLAHDVGNFLKNADWGYGRTRVVSVYAPVSQFEHGDFVEGKALVD